MKLINLETSTILEVKDLNKFFLDQCCCFRFSDLVTQIRIFAIGNLFQRWNDPPSESILRIRCDLQASHYESYMEPFPIKIHQYKSAVKWG